MNPYLLPTALHTHREKLGLGRFKTYSERRKYKAFRRKYEKNFKDSWVRNFNNPQNAQTIAKIFSTNHIKARTSVHQMTL